MITRAQWNELNNRIQTIPLETINNESALDKLESKITLIELQLLIADCNQDRSALPFRAFLNNRWEERIKNTNRIYPRQPEHPINALCITLANALSAIYGIGCYQLLMPSITHIENEITGTSLNDRDLNLHHFVLSDDNSRFIEVAPCLDCSENDGILKHCSLSNGEPQRLSETEIERVTKHSHEANQYYAAIEKVIEAQNRPTVGGMLHQTIVALKLGGEHGGRGGTEFDSGAEANVAIERICRYWNNELSEAQRTAIAPLAAPQHPNVTLGDSLGRLWRPQDANYRGVRYCVEVIANQMESILESHLDLYQMDIAPLMTARTEKQIALRNAITSENYAMTFDYPLSTLFLHDLYSLNKAQFHAVNQELVDVLNATPLETRLEWINNIMINRNTMYVKDFTSITNLMDKEQRNKIIRNMPDNHLQLQTSDEFIHSLSNIDPTIKLEFVRKIDIHNVRRVITGFILNIILDGLPLDEQPDEQLNFINSLGEECLRNIKIEQPFLLAQRQWQSYVQPMREHFNTAKKFIEQGNVGKLKNLLDQGPWEEMLEHVRTFSFGSLWEKLGAKEMAAVNVFQFILEKLNNISTQEQYSRFNQNIKREGETHIRALITKYKTICEYKSADYIRLTLSGADFYHIFTADNTSHPISKNRYLDIHFTYWNRLQSVQKYDDFETNLKASLDDAIGLISGRHLEASKQKIRDTLQTNQAKLNATDNQLNAETMRSFNYLTSDHHNNLLARLDTINSSLGINLNDPMLINVPASYLREKGTLNQLMHYALQAYQKAEKNKETKYLNIIELLYQCGDTPWELNYEQKDAFVFGKINISQDQENDTRKKWTLMLTTLNHTPSVSPLVAQMKKDIIPYTGKTLDMMNSVWKTFIALFHNYHITTQSRLLDVYQITKELWLSREKFNDHVMLTMLENLAGNVNTGGSKQSRLRDLIITASDHVNNGTLPLINKWDNNVYQTFALAQTSNRTAVAEHDVDQLQNQCETERQAREAAEQGRETERQGRETERQGRETERQSRQAAEQGWQAAEQTIRELQQRLAERSSRTPVSIRRT